MSYYSHALMPFKDLARIGQVCLMEYSFWKYTFPENLNIPNNFFTMTS